MQMDLRPQSGSVTTNGVPLCTSTRLCASICGRRKRRGYPPLSIMCACPLSHAVCRYVIGESSAPAISQRARKQLYGRTTRRSCVAADTGRANLRKQMCGKTLRQAGGHGSNIHNSRCWLVRYTIAVKTEYMLCALFFSLKNLRLSTCCVHLCTPVPRTSAHTLAPWQQSLGHKRIGSGDAIRGRGRFAPPSRKCLARHPRFHQPRSARLLHVIPYACAITRSLKTEGLQVRNPECIAHQTDEKNTRLIGTVGDFHNDGSAKRNP